MSPSSDTFCLQCDENFNFFAKSLQKDESIEEFPDVSWSKLVPEHCRFCQLLRHCIGDSQGIFTGTLRGVYASHELQLYREVEGTSRRLEYSIRHCKPASSPYPNEEPQKSGRFDVNELGLWLNQCELHQCLPSNHSQNDLPEGLRLIDVQNYCIVQPQTHVKYCALSYVWGAVQQPELTSHNRRTLEMPNSLKHLDLPKIPKTILDAMALCRDIKCPFLWVDSLCIEQDSGDDKHRQISAMAEVYSQSFLAIIACAGADANAGLAPYGKPGRNPSISYLVRKSSKGTFVASLSPQIAAQEIARSVWASRGWTLQEYALARRVLFFTGSYTFLRCEKGLWCEDFGLGFSNCFENDLKWDLPLPPFYRKKPDPDRHYSSTFSQLLAEFVRRSLSYDEDILNAFTGILTRMKDDIGSLEFGTHLWGLPSKEFGAALQWTTNLPFPSTPRIGFPSWSWAGWIHTNDLTAPNGIFHDMYGGFDQLATDISVLTCYIVEDDKIRIVEKCNLKRISLQFKRAKQRHQFSNDTAEIARLEMKLQRHFTTPESKELEAYIELHSPSKPPLSHHIFLWASCAHLYVDRPPKVTKYPVAWNFPIRIEEGGRQIGSIRLRPEWREMEPDYMHFFVSTAGIHLPPGRATYPLQVKFKVILMKLYHNTKPAVYKRIQVSHEAICQTDWILAHPESRFIALV